MSTQLIVCLVIFIVTLFSYILNKIPMWLTSMLSLAALFITGCIDAEGALSGFSNVNTILMGAMFIVAAGFRRTTMVDKMCTGILNFTKGSFSKAFAGYIILTILLANFIASPMVVYAIVSPLLMALCDKAGQPKSRYIFPIMLVGIATSGVLPGPTAIQMAGQFDGFLKAYGFKESITAIDFLIGNWPVIPIVFLWAIFLGPNFMSKEDYGEAKVQNVDKQQDNQVLSHISDVSGMIIFFGTILVLIFAQQLRLQNWWVALVGSLLMVLFGVVDHKNVLRDIPWDMILLYVGALSLGTALTNTGAGELLGNSLAKIVGGTTNSYVLGGLFFIIPFIVTQFMLNRAVSAVFVPICLLTCQALGANPIGLILLVNAGSLTAFMSPMATPAIPMAMADGNYKITDLFKGGWLISILLSIVYIGYTMTVFPCF